MIEAMVLSTDPRRARALPYLRLLALLPASLLLGHQTVFALQFGIGADLRTAMTAGGHDGYWTAFSVVIAAIVVGLLAREGMRALALRRRLAAVAAATTETGTGDSTQTPIATWR